MCGPVLWLRQQQSGKLCVVNHEKVKLVDPTSAGMRLRHAHNGSRLVLSTCIVSTSVGRDPTFGVYCPTASDGQHTVRSLPYPLWPVTFNGSGHTLQVQTPEDVAIDTQHGGIFAQATSRQSVVLVPFMAGVVFSAPEVY